MPRNHTKKNQLDAPALTKAQRAVAELGRMARLRPIWIKKLRDRERRQRARRAELLAVPKDLLTPDQDAELDYLAIDHIMAATGVLGMDPQVLANTPDDDL